MTSDNVILKVLEAGIDYCVTICNGLSNRQEFSKLRELLNDLSIEVKTLRKERWYR